MLADATQRAIGYSQLLPNFLCVEVTDRSIDPHGQGKWKHQDRMTELLTYRDNAENRTMMEAEVHRRKSREKPGKGWPVGDRTASLEVCSNRSLRRHRRRTSNGRKPAPSETAPSRFSIIAWLAKNSSFDIRLGNVQQATVGFHGQIFIENAARSVRRITMVADDLPSKFPIQAASIAVDYDYVAINNHDYLLPIDGQVRLRLGRREAVLNEIEFRNYRRFGSTVKILDYTPAQTR